MTDREGIGRLIILYSHLLDDRLWDPCFEMFAPDAVFVVGPHRWEGRNHIRREVVALAPAMAGKHFTGTPVVDLIDGTHALAWSDVTTFGYDADGRIIVSGMHRYHDRLAKIDGAWRFTHRYMMGAGEAIDPHAPPLPLR